ncbi:MAG TPA: TIGR03943 family protein [bacterium]|nr:TIGR03943 family protein [bacterium]HOL67371.1 TIGR03943 family protein [bacterium]
MKRFDTQRVYVLAVLLTWFSFILVLLASGKLSVFIRKSYAPVALMSLVLLAVMALRCGGSDSQESGPVAISLRSFFLFLFPVVLAIVVRPGTLPIMAVASRGISTSLAAADNSLLEALIARAETEGRYKKMNLKQLVSLASASPEKAGGLLVATEGLVYRKPGDPPGAFMLVRFLITCCAADATPLGIRVESENASQLKDNTWVLVRGTVSCTGGNSCIVADEVQVVPRPADPYLY